MLNSNHVNHRNIKNLFGQNTHKSASLLTAIIIGMMTKSRKQKSRKIKSRKSKILKTVHLEYFQISKEKKIEKQKIRKNIEILEKDRTIY
jgi:hypothetical protein